MSASAAPASGERVLVVDDDEDTCLLYELSLSSLGFEVASARDVRGALDLLQQRDVDVMVIDLSLGTESGTDLSRAVRSLLGEQAPPRIALSGFGDASHREASSAAGFVEHHLKPIELHDLAAAIRRVLATAPR